MKTNINLREIARNAYAKNIEFAKAYIAEREQLKTNLN